MVKYKKAESAEKRRAAPARENAEKAAAIWWFPGPQRAWTAERKILPINNRNMDGFL